MVATGYGCFKVAGKVYVTAESALKAYLSHSPALSSALHKIAGTTSKILEGVKERVGMASSKVEVTSQLEMKGVSKIEIKPHGNSKQYVGETHVYKIKNVGEDKIHKVGESMQGVNKFGQSKRAEAQARELQKETGEKFETKIIRKFGNKADARQYETDVIQRYLRMFGDDKLPGNKGNH